MPPGARRSRAAAKNSRVNSAATPAIHGFDGSEMMTSYLRVDSSRCERPSPTIRLRARIRERVAGSRPRRTATPRPPPARSRRHRRARSDGAAPRRRVTPLPSPMIADLARVLVQQQRQVRDELLREHVAAVRRVGLAVDRQRRRAGQPLDRHGRRRAFAVVEQRARLEQRLEIEVLRHERRIHVDAAREQLAVPRRADARAGTAAAAAATSRAARAAVESAPQRSRRRAPRRSGTRSRRVNVVCRPKSGNEEKPAASDPETAPTVLTA